MEVIVKSLLSLLVTLLCYAVTVITGKLSSLIKQKVQDKKISSALERVNQSVSDAVKYTAQTFVNDLKAKGEFTEEQKRLAFNTALEKAKAVLGEEVKSTITNFIGDIDEIIKVKIESEIASTK